jgi:hypothetical protein
MQEYKLLPKQPTEEMYAAFVKEVFSKAGETWESATEEDKQYAREHIGAAFAAMWEVAAVLTVIEDDKGTLSVAIETLQGE